MLEVYEQLNSATMLPIDNEATMLGLSEKLLERPPC